MSSVRIPSLTVLYFVSQAFNLVFFLVVLGLCCCAKAFSRCNVWRTTLCWDAWTSHYSGFSCWGTEALGAQTSVVAACKLSSCGLWALEHAGFSSCSGWVLRHRLRSCGLWAQLPFSMWDLPRPRIKPALQGGLLTTSPKSSLSIILTSNKPCTTF